MTLLCRRLADLFVGATTSGEVIMRVRVARVKLGPFACAAVLTFGSKPQPSSLLIPNQQDVAHAKNAGKHEPLDGIAEMVAFIKPDWHIANRVLRVLPICIRELQYKNGIELVGHLWLNRIDVQQKPFILRRIRNCR